MQSKKITPNGAGMKSLTIETNIDMYLGMLVMRLTISPIAFTNHLNTL